MRTGIDEGVVDAFVLMPPFAAIAWSYLLSGRFDEGAVAICWAVMVVALRPVVWGWAARRASVSAARASLLRERQLASVNTSVAATVMLALAALDILPLPGGPFWSGQPRASLALAAVVVYLVWLSMKASLVVEIGAGWRRLLSRTEGS